MLARIRTPALALAGFLVSALLLTRLTGDEHFSNFLPFVFVAFGEGTYALVWWLAALGFGLGLTRLALGPSVRAIAQATRSDARSTSDSTSLDEVAIAFALGCAFMLTLDSAIGSLGLLAALGGGVSWAFVAGGLLIGVRVLRVAPLESGNEVTPKASALLVGGVGAIAALLCVAASSAPGWLWSSEFGGFDALSYHLILPRKWLTTEGAVAPIDGNVYSALPSFVEAAFAHLMVLRRDILASAYVCQWWAALATLVTALVVARLAHTVVAVGNGLTSALLFLGVPWIIVIGTLAYNDIIPCLMLAGGWLVIVRSTQHEKINAPAAAALALIAASAVGAKPTAFFFTALPLLAMTLLYGRTRALKHAPLVIVLGLIVLSPWLIRNALHYGNPLFPFATELLGRGEWSEEQVTTFHAAHSASGSLLERLPLLLQQFVLHGFGNAPAPNEPWFPQWSALPLIGILGLALALRRSQHARAGAIALAIMLLAWLLFTHGKSRFLAPTAVPLALGATMLLGVIGKPWMPRHSHFVALLLAGVPFVVYMREPVKHEVVRAPAAAIDAITQLTGEPLAAALATATPEQRRELLEAATTPLALNYLIANNVKVIGIGYTTPFYVLRDVTTTSVWDRGELDRIAAASPDAPETWGAQLVALGYTHALVNPTMLDNWSRSKWLNPALEPAKWQAAFAAANRPLLRTSSGEVLYELLPKKR